MINIGVLISGGGSNLQAIIDACESGILKDKAKISLVISNKPDVFGLERAKKHNIPSVIIKRKEFADNNAMGEKIIEELSKQNVNLVCLAGYMMMIAPNVVKKYENKILNIHPALLPKFGGKGMYGHYVHEAVIKAGEKESGATVHIVDEEYDHGKTVLQEKVPVLSGDTPETLAKRVLEVEHAIYPKAILKVISGK